MVGISVGVVVAIAAAVLFAVLQRPAAVETAPLASDTPKEEVPKHPFKLGEKLTIDEENGGGDAPAKAEDPPPAPARSGALESPPAPPSPTEVREDQLPKPTAAEAAETRKPRQYKPDSGAAYTLTIDALGLGDVPVYDSIDDQALAHGVGRLPGSSKPSDGTPSNVYIVGHRLGYRGTNSHVVFYRLADLKPGDQIIVKDRGGTEYKYRVTELFKVRPQDTWVTGKLPNKNLLTLQSCSLPDLENRLIVRAEKT